MIDLVLVRHGQAAPAPLGASDAERVLSEKGQEDVGRMAAALAEAARSKAQVLTSPKVRAVQTAEAIASATGCDAPETALCLEGGSDPDAILQAVGSPGIETLILVGHEPDMGRLLARVLDPAWRGSVPFTAAAFAQVVVDDIPPTRPGRLLAFWTPA
jgi:phosphohistidine phosphatase